MNYFIDSPADVTPATLQQAAKAARYSGREQHALVMEHAAEKVRALEKRLKRVDKP